ncbi:MAG: flavodoxin family protein [Methanoregulaceae archaeon]|nr:flavodoxin family protein [Methanoregulaceae archaeon]
MKILGLNASPRGKESRTLQLVRWVLEGAEADGAKTELVDICQLDIGYCTACGTCYAKGECVLADDFVVLFEKMMEADGLVLGSPNYIDQVTAPMKAVFDRCADIIHCQMFSGKYGCSVCTAGGSGQDDVVKYMNHVLTNLGATAIGGIGVAVASDPSALHNARPQALALGKKLAESVQGRHSYREQDEIHLQRREYFCRLVRTNREIWPHEYEWYVQMGWMKD